MGSSLKEASVSGLKWSAIERFSVQGLQVIIEIILARMLTPADYGLIAVLGIFIAIGQTFVDSGFSSALVRKTDCTEEDYSTTLIFNTVVSLGYYVLMFIISPYVADFFDQPVLCTILRVLSINLIVNSFGVVPRAIFTSAVNFRSQAIASLIAAIASGVISITMAYNGFGVWSLVALTMSSSFFSVVTLWVMSSWKPSWTFSRKSFDALFGYGNKLLLSGLINTVYNHLSTIAIGKFYTKTDLGYYSRGDKFACFAAMNMTDIIQRVSFPVFAKIKDDKERLVAVYRKYISMSSMVLFLVMMMLAALSKPFIYLLLGDQWLPSVIFLQIFCFSLMFDHLNRINLNILLISGRSDLFLRLEIIKKSISVLILVCSVPLGILAIALSKVLYCQIAIYINTYYTGKLYGLGYARQIGDYVPFLLKAFVACVPAYLLTYTELHPALQLVVGGLSCVALYYLMLFRNSYMKEALAMAQSVIGRRKEQSQIPDGK